MVVHKQTARNDHFLTVTYQSRSTGKGVPTIRFVAMKHINDNFIRLVLMVLLLFPQPGVTGGLQFNVTEVTPGNYLHQGIHVKLDDPGHDDIANIGYIIGENCVAVIDTGGSVTTGQKLLENIRSITDKPICYVINTHVHFDHVLGNLAFTGEQPEYTGHVNLADSIIQNRPFFLEQFSNDLGENPTPESIIGPTKTINTSHVIDLGNRPLHITAHPKSHTHTDITVYDEQTRTLWAGDLVFRERIPVIDGSLKGWLEVLESFRKLDVAYIIPGHGPGGTSYDEVIAPLEEYLKTLLQETRAAIAQGMFLEDATEKVATDERGKWLLFDQHHKGNVSRAFIELEWE